ncbi:MAG: RnfABCDGE type electron transport complex subunit G [Termitinemataceae bacterium]|nr:MAG: RnfABCDGE type electron transport complex subunit G [Termitinemataceae bacterium]
MKDTIKMVAAIVIFAVVACAGLAVVYEKTKPAIENNQAKITADALARLFPNATGNELVSGGLTNSFDGVKLGDTYKMMQDGKIIGVAVTSSSAGFQDDIKALIGVALDGKITGVDIVQNKDTPGLGANAGKKTYFVNTPSGKQTFFGQFAGKNAASNLKVEKDGGDVIAITASTISSRAVAKLVTAAAQSGAEWLASNGAVVPQEVIE